VRGHDFWYPATTRLGDARLAAKVADFLGAYVMPVNEWSESIVIAELTEEPAFSEDMDSLLRSLDQTGESVPDVIVNMKGVQHVNSSNLAQLLKLRKRLIQGQARLRICSVNDQVWSVFLMTGLDSVFDFTEDVSTSLASLQIEGEQ
jgi:anti-anti-sigma factor